MSEKEQDEGAGLPSGSTPPERREPRRSVPPKRSSLPPPRPPTDSGQETPLAQVTFPPLSGIENEHTGDIRPLEILGTLTTDLTSSLPTSSLSPDDPGIEHPPVALGETLQLVHYARRGDTLLISGITPHGRRLTFEQREDRQGWYVLAAGRRRRPTERELGLVVATITQEMEAALVPERQAEVRSAYRLAVASDQPGLMVPGLDAYRDLLLDESQAYVSGLIDRLAVVAVDYQAFKRFANRHGHRIGAAFVRALGERLYQLFAETTDVHVFHKSGKSFRLVIANRTSAEVNGLVEQIVSDDTRSWLVRRVWGHDPRTHVSEVHFHVGIASASPAERDSTPRDLA
ncbi:MAG: GGDEF domain-containing protein, partial [Deltaproteobacteria bacterium]|nr:GGDEF domain-containing protein [Deltaproteobacteria bacterium]